MIRFPPGGERPNENSQARSSDDHRPQIARPRQAAEPRSGRVMKSLRDSSPAAVIASHKMELAKRIDRILRLEHDLIVEG